MDAPDHIRPPRADTTTGQGQAPGAVGRPGLLTADQAAAQLGVNRSTLNRWVRQGRVGYVRVGSARRYDPATLRVPAPPPVAHRPDRRDEKMWSSTDVADRLGVSHKLVLRFAERGDFPGKRTSSGRWQFSRGDIERFAGAQDIDPVHAVPLARTAMTLGVSARTLKRWGATGAITVHRGLAGARVVHRDELEQLVAGRGPNPAPDPERLTTHDVAALLGRSDEWVRQRAESGQIPFRRSASGYRRFRLADLVLEDASARPAATHHTVPAPSGGGGR